LAPSSTGAARRRRSVADVRVERVSKRYGRGRWVLRDAELTVAGGEAVTITGANGSGKSTLLRLLAGVSRPTRGAVTGRPVRVGYVPDRFPAGDAMSSVAYLTHVGRIRGLRGAAAARTGLELLERLDLAGGVRTPIRALSKGNAQKVALAQALLVPPELLVLDEPWSGLDAATHEVLGEILQEVTGSGGAVVFTDHREAVGRRHAATAYGIREGRVSRLPPPTVVVAAEPSRIVLTDPAGRARRLDWAGLPGVTDAEPDGPDLHLTVQDTESDGLLLTALRHGWSIAEVRRCRR
jgi:ABC-2 type transport system ATP-binding protein